MKLTPEQLADVAQLCISEKGIGIAPNIVKMLLAHIYAVESERDAALAALRKIAGMQVGEGYDWAQRVAGKALGK